MKKLKNKVHKVLLFVRYSIIMVLHYEKEAAVMGELIAVLSGKGGTGKTSLCAGIATALAQQGENVLCIDCDVGLRNLDIALGMSDSGALSFADLFGGEYTLAQAGCHRDFPNLRFLTAPVNCRAEDVDREAFATLLKAARRSFSYIFLDAPAGIDAGFRLCASFADRVILVTNSDPGSIRDAGHTASLLETMGKAQTRVVVNRLNEKMFSATSRTVDDLMDEVGLPLLGIVPEDMNIPLSAAFGTPLLGYSKKSAAANACRRIAKRLMGFHVPLTIR